MKSFRQYLKEEDTDDLVKLVGDWVESPDQNSKLLSAKIPSKFKKVSAKEIYRGIGISNKQLKELQSGKSIKLKPSKGESYSLDWDVAQLFIEDLATADVGIIVTKKPVTKNVIINIPLFAKLLKLDKSDPFDNGYDLSEQEIVIKPSKYYSTINPGDVEGLEDY